MKTLGSKLTTSYQSDIKELIYLDVNDHQTERRRKGSVMKGGTGELNHSATIRKLGTPLLSLMLYENVKLVIRGENGSFDPPTFTPTAEENIMNVHVYQEVLQKALDEFGVSVNDIIIEPDNRDDKYGRVQKAFSILNGMKLKK
jgi:hypothetical protein